MPNIYMNEEGEQVAQNPLGHALIEPPLDHTIEYHSTDIGVQGSPCLTRGKATVIRTVRYTFVFSQALQDDRIVNERRHMLALARIHLAEGVLEIMTHNSILYEQMKTDKVEALCKEFKKDELIKIATEDYRYDVNLELITANKLNKMTKAQISMIIADCFFKKQAEEAAINQCLLWDEIDTVYKKIVFVYGKTGQHMKDHDLTDREKEVIMSYLIKEGEEE